MSRNWMLSGDNAIFKKILGLFLVMVVLWTVFVSKSTIIFGIDEWEEILDEERQLNATDANWESNYVHRDQLIESVEKNRRLLSGLEDVDKIALEEIKGKMQWLKYKQRMIGDYIGEIRDWWYFREHNKISKEEGEKRRRELVQRFNELNDTSIIQKELSEKKNKLQEQRKKNWELKDSLDKLLSEKQRREKTRLKGRNWHGELPRFGGMEYEREYKRGDKDVHGEDRRLLVFFVPIPLMKEHLRNLIRATYKLSLPEDVDMFFSIGKPKNEMERRLLRKENEAYGDILELDADEGMNNGKTYKSFMALKRMFGIESPSHIRYDFVGKVDDDSYLNLPSLSNFIDTNCRTRAYIGWKMSNPSIHMQGRGYFMSWDLLEYVGKSKWVEEHIVGDEDLVTGQWMLRKESKANWRDTGDEFGDFRYSNNIGGIRYHNHLWHTVKTSSDWNDVAIQRGWNKNVDFQEFLHERGKIPFIPHNEIVTDESFDKLGRDLTK
eukprot:TRINITY_DN5550_c0_g2_i1.p1 TRINITY_DN5550_c0_g2~~TRINITY_DN5550_c0_g2_i1.p1  ORF type:complete len:494 (-),score=174.77 TRINITY_DN5550_c0_g2_i1:270-1751(-)